MTDSLTDADIGFYNCSLTNVAGTCHYDIYLDAKENNMAVSTSKFVMFFHFIFQDLERKPTLQEVLQP